MVQHGRRTFSWWCNNSIPDDSKRYVPFASEFPGHRRIRAATTSMRHSSVRCVATSAAIRAWMRGRSASSAEAALYGGGSMTGGGRRSRSNDRTIRTIRTFRNATSNSDCKNTTTSTKHPRSAPSGAVRCASSLHRASNSSSTIERRTSRATSSMPNHQWISSNSPPADIRSRMDDPKSIQEDRRYCVNLVKERDNEGYCTCCILRFSCLPSKKRQIPHDFFPLVFFMFHSLFTKPSSMRLVHARILSRRILRLAGL